MDLLKSVSLWVVILTRVRLPIFGSPQTPRKRDHTGRCCCCCCCCWICRAVFPYWGILSSQTYKLIKFCFFVHQCGLHWIVRIVILNILSLWFDFFLFIVLYCILQFFWTKKKKILFFSTCFSLRVWEHCISNLIVSSFVTSPFYNSEI